MICPCPKCTAPIESDMSQLVDAEFAVACPGCKAKVLILRESFARRAYRRSSDICCAECGGQLGDSVNCPVCGALYPDYMVADTPDAVRRRRRASKKWEPFKGVELSLWSRSGGDQGSGYVPQRTVSTTPTETADTSRKHVGLVVTIAVVIIALAGAVGAYSTYQKSQRYAKDYAVALYGLKTGIDLSANVSQKVAEDWKKKLAAGMAGQPKPTADDEAHMAKVKSQVDKLMQKMQEPPSKFAAANERIMKLNGIYTKAHALALAPTGSPQEFNDSVAKIQQNFATSAKELITSMPEPLSEEFKLAQKKYIGLRNL